jgi:histidyl-tRNA synthetase
MVYETFLDDDMWLWSISSGGRYENLTTYIDSKRNFSWVGWSIWISRLMALIFENGEWSKQTTTNYLCINFKETFGDICNIAQKLRKENNNVEIYPSADKLGKQFWYADKKGIPLVIILGEWEKKEWIYKIKDMIAGTETIHKI